MAVLPISREAKGGLNVTNTSTGLHISTWGGPVMRVPGDETWHMHAALLDKGCGITSWMTNSLVVHATASNPAGPYDVKDVSLLPWSHNPGTAVAPDGRLLMFHVGDGATGQSKEVTRGRGSDGADTGGCFDGASPCGMRHGCNSTAGDSALAEEPDSSGSASSRKGCWFGRCGANISFHTATSPAGPWAPFTAPTTGEASSMSTPSPWMLQDSRGKQNGTIFLVTGGLWRAETWRGPYEKYGSVSCHGEDPYLHD